MWPPTYDAIIIGQGIAGTTLGWRLVQSGKRVLILDENLDVTSSKIAAGLITPITGKRFVLSRDFDLFYQEAATYYRQLEDELGVKFFHEYLSQKFLSSEEEKSFWKKRADDPEYLKFVASQFPDDNGFLMKGAQLDVQRYLQEARDKISVENVKIDWQRDVSFHEKGVEVMGEKASAIISCEGFHVVNNPYFKWVPFNAAKGEILHVRFAENMEKTIYHFGLWMAPAAEKNCFYVGATYDWEGLDDIPTREGRDEIEKRLKEFTPNRFEVLDHKAAVRPIIFQSMAVIGSHPKIPNLYFFNGLGSKGSLQAPLYAKKLRDHIFGNCVLEEDINVQKYWK